MSPKHLSFMLLGVVLAAFPGAARANGHQPPAPPPYLIDQMTGSRSYAILVPALDGGLYLVWSHPENSDTTNLFAQHLNGFGERQWAAPGKRIARGLSSSRDWDAFADGKGNLVAAWIEGGEIKAQRFAPSGKRSWKTSSFRVSLSTGPRTAVVGSADGVGGLYFVWTEETAADNSVLIGQRMDPLGQRAWGDNGFRITPSDTHQWRPRVMPDGQGGLLVAWRSSREGISRIRVQRLGALPAPMWPAMGVDMIPVSGSLDERPLLAAPGDGSAVLAWTEGFAGLNHVKWQKADPSGTRIWPPEGQLLSAGAWEQWNPADLGDGRGGLWFGWEDFRTVNQSQVYLVHVGGDGTPWNAGEIPIGPISANQARLALANDGSQGVLAAWVDNRAGVGLYLQRINSDGKLMLGASGLLIANNRNSPQRPQVLFMAPDRAAVVWFEKPADSTWQLYGKIVALPQFSGPH